MPTERAPTVLFVAGWGRSGSTLLGRMLDERPGVVCAGEVWNVFSVGFKRNLLCGCGQPFRECPFWGEVAERAFGGMDSVDGRARTRDLRAVACIRKLPGLIMRRGRASRDARLVELTAELERFYKAIAEVSGASVVVDLSKTPQFGFVLRRMSAIDLVVLHLVRDSRAVSHSWGRLLRRPEITSREVYIDQVSPVRSAWAWNVANLLSGLLRAVSDRPLFLRYEDLVASPRAAIAEISDRLGIAGPEPEYAKDGVVHLGARHIAAGNPMRFSSGDVHIAPDEAWREGASGIVTVLTAPLLLRYRYSLRTGAPPVAARTT